MDILPILSILAAFISAYYAMKSYQNYKFNIMPLLIPENDTSNPKKLKVIITNKGVGPAKDIRILIKSINIDDKINQILLANQQLIYEKDISFKNGDNPLFDQNINIEFRDLDDNIYVVMATFKRDVIEERAKLGHVDKFFSNLGLKTKLIFKKRIV